MQLGSADREIKINLGWLRACSYAKCQEEIEGF